MLVKNKKIKKNNYNPIDLSYCLGGLGECVPGHQGVRGLTPLGPTLKIILGVMLMTWFLDPSSHWPLYYDLAFQTHVLSLDFDHRPAHIKAIEFLPSHSHVNVSHAFVRFVWFQAVWLVVASGGYTSPRTTVVWHHVAAPL